MLSIQTESEYSILHNSSPENLWEAATEMGYPAAIWRLPHSQEVKLLISVQNDISKQKPDFEKLSPGFIISPFHWIEDQHVFYLEGDIFVTITSENQISKIESRLGEEHPAVKTLISLASSRQQSKTIEPIRSGLTPSPFLHDTDSKERFTRAVELAIGAIRQNGFKKIVLSRTKHLPYSEEFRPIKAFLKLLSSYPHAFVSLVNLPQQNELWLGASPETLVEQKSNGMFRTMSLAGTQKAKNADGETIPKYDIRWGQKEIEEHALVSRYIVECFKRIRLREYVETGPKTALAGNVYHLKTEFEVDTVALDYPELASMMIKLLHPTSAVCGEPKAPSLEFLSKIEGYDRSFYSGFLGPVQVEQESNIFVNLRTVRLKDGNATFFAGAGITEDSDPEKEWEETEMKCDTLLKVIGEDFKIK